MKGVLDVTEKRGALEMLSRVRNSLSEVFAYGVSLGLCSHNPVQGLKGVFKTHTPRNRPRVDVSKVPALLRAMDSYQGTPQTHLILRLAPYVALRHQELLGKARGGGANGREAIPSPMWTEIDWDKAQWRIPRARINRRTGATGSRLSFRWRAKH